MKKFKTVFFGILLLIPVCAIAGTTSNPNPEAFIVLDNAKEVRFINHGASPQMRYLIKAEPPASPVIAELSRRVEKLGWASEKEDYLNPGGQLFNWDNFIDAMKEGSPSVQQWIGDWKNEHGDILRYILRYETNSKTLTKREGLLVIAILTSAEHIRHFKQSIEKQGPVTPNGKQLQK